MHRLELWARNTWASLDGELTLFSLPHERSLILAILDLVKVLDSPFRDSTAVASLAIVIVILFIGAYGSYKHDRSFLLTFALILIIAIVVGFLSSSALYASLGMNILLVVLALTQAELIRKGHS